MSIVAECPHCETRFNLQPDLAGKSMRCPNPDCRQVFVVQAGGGRPAPKPRPRPDPEEGLPTVEAEIVPLPPVKPARPARPSRPSPPAAPPARARSQPKPAEFEVVEEPACPPGVQEVEWSADADVPPPPPAKGKPEREPKESRRSPVRAAAVDEYDDDDLLQRRKRKKPKNRSVVVLFAMGVLILGLLGAGAAYIYKLNKKGEANADQQALDQFKKGDYTAAGKSYEKLLADSPNSPNNDRYKLMADICGVRVAIGSVANKEDPSGSIKKVKAFQETHKSSPLAKPTADGFGAVIYDGGQKLADDIAGFANERVAAFRSDNAKLDELKRAEDMLAEGKTLIPVLQSFRPQDSPSLDGFTQNMDRVRGEIDRERKRLATLATVQETLTVPTDETIEEAKRILATNSLASDAKGLEMIRAAEAAILAQLQYVPDPAPHLVPAAPSASSILFVSPVRATKPVGPDEPAASGGVFLGVARGVLFALDEDGGGLLWAVRVGPDATDAPTVARVETGSGPTDIVLVTSNVGGKPALTAHVLRTGFAIWQQPLAVVDPTNPERRIPTPAAGPAVVVGTRAYVPLRDAMGTVVQFDLGQGNRLGRFALGQQVGPAPVIRPGSGQLFVAADARRVFVFDVDAKDANDNRLDPRCVRVIPTGHAPGTLRTPPTFLGAAGDGPGARWLVLSQADGSTAMKIRAFPLPPSQSLPPGAPPLTEPIAAESQVSLPGWAWFPPVSDGERVATVTDLGQVRLYGVKQLDNNDPALFPLPSPVLPQPADGSPVPGLAVPSEEGAFWVLASGVFQQYRLTLLPKEGLSAVPVGGSIAVGVPTQPAQLNARRDTVCLIVRSMNSAGCRAVAVRLSTGEVRWQRQLGAVAAAPPTPAGGGVLLVDDDGGVIAIPASGLDFPQGGTKAATADWAVASPPESVVGPTAVVASPDGHTVYALTPTGTIATPRFVIRRAVDGKIDHTGGVNVPAALAGPPAVYGNSLLLPAADGLIYRVVLGDGKARADQVQPGPRWKIDLRLPDATGYAVPVADDAFLTSDGSRTLTLWRWPQTGNWTDAGAKWEVRERVAMSPLVLPAGGGRPASFLVADVTGGVWLYTADKPAAAVRRWLPGKAVGLPTGRPAGGFALQPDAGGKQVVAYVVNNKQVVCLDLNDDKPRWATPPNDDPTESVVGPPRPAGKDRWLLTELSGRVSILDGATGAAVMAKNVSLPGAIPAAAAVMADPSRVLVPLSDGSAAVLEFPAEASAKQ